VPESNPTLTVNLAILIGIALGLLFWLIYGIYCLIAFLIKKIQEGSAAVKREQIFIERYNEWSNEEEVQDGK